MQIYSLIFIKTAKKQYEKLDKSIKEKIKKKLIQLKEKNKKRRHLKFGKQFFVDEVGQYRIVYEIKNKKNIIILFIGKHKDYETYFK